MKLIIDIPEDMYYAIEHRYWSVVNEAVLLSCVANGTPLPKGHGRIADMDEAIKCIEDVEGEDAIWAIGLIEWACSKRTIIEADMERGRNDTD